MSRAGLLELLLLVACCIAATQAFYGPSSDVVVLTPANFKSKVLDAKGIVLVEFFASWCGHCKALTPAWEKAATALKGVVRVAALDADTHKSLAQEYGLQGFPTIKVFGLGKSPVDYQGPRDAKGITEYALQQVKTLVSDRLKGKSSSGGSKKSEPSASTELTSKNFDDLVVNSNDVWLVEFFAPWCGHCKKLAPEWKSAANRLKGKVRLGQVDCDAHKDLMSRYGVEGFPTILLFGGDKSNPTRYEGAREASAIESYALEQVETNSVPAEVVQLTSNEVMSKHCGSAPICFVTFVPHILDSKAEGRNQYLEILKGVADKFKKSSYGYVWAEAGEQASLENAVGVGGYGYPALVALNIKKNIFAPLKSSFELNSISEFVKEAGRGGKGNIPLGAEYVIEEKEAWNGKDGEVIEEDEFSLEELMATDSKEEL